MKKRNGLYLILLLILFCIILIQIVTPTIGTKIASILTTITTIVGIFSVFLEMKRSAEIAECTFILELQKYFEETPAIQDIFNKLDDLFYNENIQITKEDRHSLSSYFTFLEMLCNLILKGSIKIKDIDNLFSYPFFLGVNCKKAQQLELLVSPEYYQNIMRIYPIWYQYRKRMNSPIPWEEDSIYMDTKMIKK